MCEFRRVRVHLCSTPLGSCFCPALFIFFEATLFMNLVAVWLIDGNSFMKTFPLGNYRIICLAFQKEAALMNEYTSLKNLVDELNKEVAKFEQLWVLPIRFLTIWKPGFQNDWMGTDWKSPPGNSRVAVCFEDSLFKAACLSDRALCFHCSVSMHPCVFSFHSYTWIVSSKSYRLQFHYCTLLSYSFVTRLVYNLFTRSLTFLS